MRSKQMTEEGCEAMLLSCVSDKDLSVLASDFCFNLSGHLDSRGRLGLSF